MPDIDDQTIALITERVVAALRDELEAIAASLLADHRSQPMTVGDVAERFGVARSTVYAHWREWGGYKLGDRAKAPIRFERDRLPTVRATDQLDESVSARRPARQRRRRNLIADAPRLDHSIEELG